jgi:hypothetical protein
VIYRPPSVDEKKLAKFPWKKCIRLVLDINSEKLDLQNIHGRTEKEEYCR